MDRLVRGLADFGETVTRGWLPVSVGIHYPHLLRSRCRPRVFWRWVPGEQKRKTKKTLKIQRRNYLLSSEPVRHHSSVNVYYIAVQILVLIGLQLVYPDFVHLGRSERERSNHSPQQNGRGGRRDGEERKVPLKLNSNWPATRSSQFPPP